MRTIWTLAVVVATSACASKGSSEPREDLSVVDSGGPTSLDPEVGFDPDGYVPLDVADDTPDADTAPAAPRATTMTSTAQPGAHALTQAGDRLYFLTRDSSSSPPIRSLRSLAKDGFMPVTMYSEPSTST